MRLPFYRALIKALIRWLTHPRRPSHIPMSDFQRIRYEIKPGDVLLVEGTSRVAEVVKLITQSRFSQAALYVGRLHDIADERVRNRVQSFFDGPHDTQLIIESELGMGTVVRSLQVYENDHLRICRPRDIRFPDLQNVINYAVSRLGMDYDVRQIFDLFRLMFPWKFLPRRWRSSLFRRHPGRPTRTVCSTMIAEAFAAIDYPILPLVKQLEHNEYRLYRRNPKLCVPCDFDYSPYFDIIKYPFIDFSFVHDYRHLPWERDDTLVPHTSAAGTPLDDATGVASPPPEEPPAEGDAEADATKRDD